MHFKCENVIEIRNISLGRRIGTGLRGDESNRYILDLNDIVTLKMHEISKITFEVAILEVS